MGLFDFLSRRKITALENEVRDMKTAVGKALTLKDPTLMRIFGWGDKTALHDEYEQLPIVYACVRACATNISQVPFRIYQKGSDVPIKSGPLYDLFEEVNPYYNKYQLWESNVSMLMLKGEAFVGIDPEERSAGVPRYLWPFNPENVDNAYAQQFHIGWYVNRNGARLFFDLSEMVHPKYFNPKNEIRGLSPLAAGETSNNTGFAAMKYNEVYFDNDAMPGTVFTSEQQLPDPTFRRLKHELIEKRKGYLHASEALLLDAGMDVKSMRASNKDMQFLELIKLTREDIMMIYKVPKSEISLYEDINYATALSADLGFWKKTLIPMMRHIQDSWNKTFFNPRGYMGRFDYESLDVLNSEILQKGEAAKIYWSMGVPFNQINEKFNLGFEPFSEGELPWTGRVPREPVGMQMRDVTIPLSGSAEPLKLTGPEFMEELKRARYKKITSTEYEIVARFSRVLRNYFYRAQQAFIGRFAKSFSTEVTKQFDDLSIEFAVFNAFDDDELKSLAEDFFQDAHEAGANSVPFQVSLQDAQVSEILSKRVTQFMSVNETARKRVSEQISREIQKLVDEGASEETIAREVGTIAKDAFKTQRNYVRTIARTEVHGAFNEARWETLSLDENKPPRKEWLTARSGNVRITHTMAELQGPIPFDQPFDNGLMYPMEPGGMPDEVINCRCVLLPVFEEE